jgi:hypothetical protein
LPALEDGRVHLGGHVRSRDDVLDRHGAAVDRRERRALAVAAGGLVGGLARGLEIQRHERLHRRLATLEGRDAALEEIAGGILAGAKRVGGARERDRVGILPGIHAGIRGG